MAVRWYKAKVNGKFLITIIIERMPKILKTKQFNLLLESQNKTEEQIHSCLR